MGQLMNPVKPNRKTKVFLTRREFAESEYKRLFRFEKNSVQWIGNYFLGDKNEYRGKALSSENQMKVFLRYIADQNMQIGVGVDLGVRQATVSMVLNRVCYKIVSKASDWIKFPSSFEEIEKAKGEWEKVYHFPCAIGVLDTTHIPITKPAKCGDDYVNRLGDSTLNVQATCNSQEMFTSVNSSSPGYLSNSSIWMASEFRNVIRENKNQALLLGTSEYGVEPFLLTPFNNPTTPQQLSYNNLHQKERLIIERCFGQMKTRFPILQNKIRVRPIQKASSIVTACFVLHNIAKYLKDKDFDNEKPAGDGYHFRTITQEKTAVKARGVARRNEIAEIIHKSWKDNKWKM